MTAPQSNKKLYKTVITIYTDYDPSHLEIEDLARDATSGESYCTGSNTTVIKSKDFAKIKGVGSGFFDFFCIEPPTT